MTRLLRRFAEANIYNSGPVRFHVSAALAGLVLAALIVLVAMLPVLITWCLQ